MSVRDWWLIRHLLVHNIKEWQNCIVLLFD